MVRRGRNVAAGLAYVTVLAAAGLLGGCETERLAARVIRAANARRADGAR